MGAHPEYLDKYAVMKQEYLSGKSLSEVCREYKADRGSFSKRLKQDGIEVINKQNLAKVNEHYFDEIDCQGKAYWLGFLYADGAISSRVIVLNYHSPLETLSMCRSFNEL